MFWPVPLSKKNFTSTRCKGTFTYFFFLRNKRKKWVSGDILQCRPQIAVIQLSIHHFYMFGILFVFMFQHIFCLFLSRAVTDFKGCQLLSCESKWDVKNRHKNTAARLSAAESTLDIIDLRALNQQRLDGIMPAQSFWWAIVDCCFWLCLCQYSTYYSCIIMHQSKVCRSVLFFLF